MAEGNETDDQLIVKGTTKSRDVPISGPNKLLPYLTWSFKLGFFFRTWFHLSFNFQTPKDNLRRTFNSSIFKQYNLLYWNQILINIFLKIPIRLNGSWSRFPKGGDQRGFPKGGDQRGFIDSCFNWSNFATSNYIVWKKKCNSWK